MPLIRPGWCWVRSFREGIVWVLFVGVARVQLGLM